MKCIGSRIMGQVGAVDQYNKKTAWKKEKDATSMVSALGSIDQGVCWYPSSWRGR